MGGGGYNRAFTGILAHHIRGIIMQIDKYTKTVLTVIAVALTALVLQNSIGVAVASSGIQKVQICDYSGDCAYIRDHALKVGR